MRSKAVALVAIVVSLALLAGCALVSDEPGKRAENVAQEAPPPSARVPENEPVARVASQIGPSVVQVNVQAVQETPFGTQEEGEGLGSGVIYRRDGYVITNNHVVEGADSVNIAFADGTVEQGEVVGADPYTDLAVVRVDRRNLPAASFRESADLVVGQLAVAIGSPSGFQSTVTSGVISGLSRDLPPELTGSQTPLVDLVQSDAAISPGSSGGALVDRAGEVVGINVAYLPPAETGAESIGFAIPSDTAITVADQLIETGRATQPYLGIGLEEITPEDAARFDVPGGVLVTDVERGGPSDEAGLRRGDVITAAGSVETASYGDLLGALRDYRPGDTIALSVIRNGNTREIEVQLAERPQQ